MTNNVESVILQLTRDFIEEWGLEDIAVTKDTRIKADIGFDSSDTMQLFAAISEHYSGTDFTFQELVVRDGKFVDDLSLGQIAVFVLRKLMVTV